MKKVYFAHDRQESPEERKSYLELTGYVVTLFSNSADLLEACKEEDPDLVILDTLLPGKNGFDTAREVRLVVAASVPLVLCSRIYKTEVFREEAVKVGCDGYLHLPVQMGEFLACVQSVSQAASARANSTQEAA